MNQVHRLRDVNKRLRFVTLRHKLWIRPCVCMAKYSDNTSDILHVQNQWKSSEIYAWVTMVYTNMPSGSVVQQGHEFELSNWGRGLPPKHRPRSW